MHLLFANARLRNSKTPCEIDHAHVNIHYARMRFQDSGWKAAFLVVTSGVIKLIIVIKLPFIRRHELSEILPIAIAIAISAIEIEFVAAIDVAIEFSIVSSGRRTIDDSRRYRSGIGPLFRKSDQNLQQQRISRFHVATFGSRKRGRLRRQVSRFGDCAIQTFLPGQAIMAIDD